MTPTHYRMAVFIVHRGRRYLEAVYTRPKALDRALRLMQKMNPTRVYEVDAPENGG